MSRVSHNESHSLAPDVTLKDLSVCFGANTILHALNVTFAGGRWSCLLGRSGAGKSTLLKAIAGLLPKHTQGQVTASDGQPIHERVAWMGQQDLLLPWLSAHDNVLLGQRLRGEDTHKAKDRAALLLEQVGLSTRQQAMPHELSGGQRQRVALARTLMEDRPIVLMDEPFSALDAITRLQLQDLACERLSQHTVILITHDPLEALRLGDGVYVMHANGNAETQAPKTPPHRTQPPSTQPPDTQASVLSPPLQLPTSTPRAVTSPDVIDAQKQLLSTLLQHPQKEGAEHD